MAVFVPGCKRRFSLHSLSRNTVPTGSVGALRLWATKGRLRFGFGAAILLFSVADIGSSLTAAVVRNNNKHVRRLSATGSGQESRPGPFMYSCAYGKRWKKFLLLPNDAQTLHWPKPPITLLSLSYCYTLRLFLLLDTTRSFSLHLFWYVRALD